MYRSEKVIAEVLLFKEYVSYSFLIFPCLKEAKSSVKLSIAVGRCLGNVAVLNRQTDDKQCI